MNTENRFNLLSENELKTKLSFNPVEKLGQNFLIDPDVAKKFIDSVILGAEVVEIGSGPANLTVGFAERASSVIGLEIFPDYNEIQSSLVGNLNNVEIFTQNALKFDYKKWAEKDSDFLHQIVGSIPFNISEPLLTILAKIGNKVDNITLLVGDNLAEIITEKNPKRYQYTKLSFITGTFDSSKIMHVPRKCFWPVPRTDADIVSLNPIENSPGKSTISFQLQKKIIQNQELSLAKIIRNFSPDSNTGKNLDKKLSHRLSRRQKNSELKHITDDYNFNFNKGKPIDKIEINNDNQSLIKRINLPQEILSKPFRNLNNEEVRQLAIAINKL